LLKSLAPRAGVFSTRKSTGYIESGRIFFH
jgi:hypothetical protein